mmetsp:Transcript_2890/g.3386  ORF Transcript_2890/g.3386 Transcript_2890/m.3386 type:complete len:209 (+) Transcript_2890:729-1355(+)
MAHPELREAGPRPRASIWTTSTRWGPSARTCPSSTTELKEEACSVDSAELMPEWSPGTVRPAPSAFARPAPLSSTRALDPSQSQSTNSSSSTPLLPRLVLIVCTKFWQKAKRQTWPRRSPPRAAKAKGPCSSSLPSAPSSSWWLRLWWVSRPTPWRSSPAFSSWCSSPCARDVNARRRVGRWVTTWRVMSFYRPRLTTRSSCCSSGSS